MDKTIKLRVKKEIDSKSELMVLKLKGTLISKGYTEIIHIADENTEYYLNSFSTSPENKKEAEYFVLDYITNNNLDEIISYFKKVLNDFRLRYFFQIMCKNLPDNSQNFTH